jgi:succinate dehydrogenase / fumarate reductase iron-sulfur subunit
MTTEDAVIFRIARQDKPGGARYWQSFSVPHVPGMNVISALQSIAAHPLPIGEHEPATPVVWDCNCLEEVCGACTMIINGRVRQACTALVDEIGRTGAGEIELEPMTKYPIVRLDGRSAADVSRVEGGQGVDSGGRLPRGGTGAVQGPEDQEESYPLSQCMTCGCCMEACPQYEGRSRGGCRRKRCGLSARQDRATTRSSLARRSSRRRFFQ